MVTAFGPSAIATPANAITGARLVLSPLVFVLILVFESSLLTAGVWLVLASTDSLDGWVARRMGVTRSGAFLDPLADKALVLGAMWAIVLIGEFWWLPVALVTVREVTISLFRSYWGRRGLAVPAQFVAKLKTLVQSVAVGLALLPAAADDHQWLVTGSLWLAVALTVATGAQYMLEGSRATTAGAVRSAAG